MNDENTKEKAPAEKPAKKVPKKSSLTVSSGKTKKRRVSGQPKKAETSGREKSKEKPPERDLTTSSHTAQRIDRRRQEIRRERLQARKAEVLRNYLLGGIILVILIILVIAAAIRPGSGTGGSSAAGTAETAAAEIPEGMVSVSASEVRHFSFKVLLSDEMAGDDDSILTISEFQSILQQLYDAGYILVDYYSIADVQTNEDGSSSYSTADLVIPEGKIPFVLSVRDACYSLDRVGKGYASRLIVTEEGQITDEYQNVDGSVVRGSYDVVTILEDFITEHPDFSHENARGILALSGYNGILGYRTTEILGKTAEEGNAYAVYGVYDVSAEIEGVKPVVSALQEKNWHFASYGYNYCSYGAEYSMMVSDMEAWVSSVSPLIGGTDLLLFPCETDIGGWSEYQEDNERYQYLKSQGFSYFCIQETVNPSWLQIRSGYVRQGIKEIDCYDDFTQIMGE